MPDYIASREFRAHHPGRGEFTITLRIGAPYRSDDDWACAVTLEGLIDNLKPQHGVDSWQALVLAVYLARTVLGRFVEAGGKIFDLNNQVADLDRLFTAGI